MSGWAGGDQEVGGPGTATRRVCTVAMVPGSPKQGVSSW